MNMLRNITHQIQNQIYFQQNEINHNKLTNNIIVIELPYHLLVIPDDSLKLLDSCLNDMGEGA